MDRSLSRLSNEEYLAVLISCGYDSAHDYGRYLSGRHDGLYDGFWHPDEYNKVVVALEQAERVKLLQEALDV